MEEISSEVAFISEWQGDLSLTLALAKGPKNGGDNVSPWRGFSLCWESMKHFPQICFLYIPKSQNKC
jgi:hypothetical protein